MRSNSWNRERQTRAVRRGRSGVWRPEARELFIVGRQPPADSRRDRTRLPMVSSHSGGPEVRLRQLIYRLLELLLVILALIVILRIDMRPSTNDRAPASSSPPERSIRVPSNRPARPVWRIPTGIRSAGVRVHPDATETTRADRSGRWR